MTIDEIAVALTKITVQDDKFKFYNDFDKKDPNHDNTIKVFEVYKTMYNLVKDFHSEE